MSKQTKKKTKQTRIECTHTIIKRKLKKKHCRNPGSNQGPLDLQSNALPTELSRHYISLKRNIFCKNVVLVYSQNVKILCCFSYLP